MQKGGKVNGENCTKTGQIPLKCSFRVKLQDIFIFLSCSEKKQRMKNKLLQDKMTLFCSRSLSLEQIAADICKIDEISEITLCMSGNSQQEGGCGGGGAEVASWSTIRRGDGLLAYPWEKGGLLQRIIFNKYHVNFKFPPSLISPKYWQYQKQLKIFDKAPPIEVCLQNNCC